MTSKDKDTWEKLASEEEKGTEDSKTFETLEEIDKALRDAGMPDEDDRGFRLPYSSRPKLANGRWK